MEEHVTSLFVGVVSHERSRFAVSQGSDGLAARLAEGMRKDGLSVDVRVNIDNLHDPARHPVDAEVVRRSVQAQSQLEQDWTSYLEKSTGAVASVRAAMARYWRGLEGMIRPADESMVTRLINIELSHLDLFDAGLASGAPWVLVLEDDAMSENVDDCVAGLVGLMDDSPAPGFINLSHSFSLEELGIAHLLQPAGVTWQGSIERQILTAQRPVTNTVCAVMYHSEFLRRMVQAMRQLPFYPVVPIDWRINQALMAMVEAGTAGVNTAWFVEPGPIDQMSMR